MEVRQSTLNVAFAVCATSFFVCQPLMAQDTRADVIREQQALRQQDLEPPRYNGAERFIERLQDWGFVTVNPRGLYPWLGSVYPGGGWATGAGYRKPFGDDAAVNVFGGYSIARFARVEGEAALPTFLSNRARITLTGRYIDAPDVSYYGTGNSSEKDDRTRFGYTPTTGGARVDVELSERFKIGGGVNYHHVETSSGRTAPSIEESFTPGNTPGLELATYKYINSTARAVYDWRRPLGYSGRGGFYRAQFDDYREGDNELYSSKQVDGEAVQLIPIPRANWVIALRGLATISDLADSNDAPYFLMPALGGGSTIRGYPDFRFRDQNRLLMS